MTSRTLTLDEALAAPEGPRRTMAVRNTLRLEPGEAVLEARPGVLMLRLPSPARARSLSTQLARLGWAAEITHDKSNVLWQLVAFE